MKSEQDRTLIEVATRIIASFVSNNAVRAAELPGLIETVHLSLQDVSAPKPAPNPGPELKPAVPVKKSVTDDYIVCLEDGKRFKSLKRHLQQAFGMTPDEYRAKWNLPRTYPMVAPGYAVRRSELARAIGLGRKNQPGSSRAKPPEPPAPPPPPPPEAKRRRGRPRRELAPSP